MKDPYKALGVSPEASPTEIKKAYRRLAKDYHPDRTGGDKVKEARFKDVSVAYDILSDKDKRSRYDAMKNGGGIPDGVMDLGDLFAQMFGGGGMGGGMAGGGRRQAQPGFGSGGMGGSPFGGGMGGSPFGAGSPFGHQQPQRPQPQAPRKKKAPKERKVRASDGSTLTQRGGNIYSDLRISFDKAILGTVANVPTLSGTAKVKVPSGTSSGLKLRLKSRGARLSSGHGDHFITVQIDVPKVESDSSKERLAELVKSLSNDQ